MTYIVPAMDNLPQHLRWQIAALLYALAYLAGICVFAWMAKRRNISTSGIWLLMQAGLLGGLVGGKRISISGNWHAWQDS